MFNDMNHEDIVRHARDKGLGEFEANELATLATTRCADATRQDFDRYWFFVKKLGA